MLSPVGRATNLNRELSAGLFSFGSVLPASRTSLRVVIEKEEEAGGSGWDARKQKSEFLQRVSITIAKGNSRVRVLDCMRHDWQSSTAPGLVTSTVHNPRTLAATSDPGTHDPTAATPAGGP